MDESEISDLDALLSSIYVAVKGRFLTFSDFQNVIVKDKDYHANQLQDGQKPEEMVKQFIVEPILKHFGYLQSSREGTIDSPFGKRSPDYVIHSSTEKALTLYVEVEPINADLFAFNKGIGQISQWLLSKAAKTDLGIATDGLNWRLVKFDGATNKTNEIMFVSLKSYFRKKLHPSDSLDHEEKENLERFIYFSPKYLEKVINDYLVESETVRENLTRKFYSDYVEYVFGLDKEGKETSGACLKNSIITEPEVTAPTKELFAVVTMNRLLFITFLEEKSLVPINLITSLWEKYKTSNLPGTFYSTYLRPLFYEVLNKDPKSRNEHVRESHAYDTVPYLNGGLFRRNIDLEDLYDIRNDGIQIVVEKLLKYKIGLSGEAEIRPEILGYIFEKTINYITAEPDKTDKQKQEGAYYTPEDVVNFITRETISKKIYEKMLLGLRNSGWKEKDLLGISSIEDILQSMPKNRKHAYQMINAIDGIKILDPACGSGHFLTTAANILARVRASILIAINEPVDTYNIKRLVISKNIFGVDIDEIGVEITKLRLWLSIIAEAMAQDIQNKEHIETLPNIDFNIIVGNSLVGSINEKLFYDLEKPDSDIWNLKNHIDSIGNLNPSLKSEIEELMNNNTPQNLSKIYQILLNVYRAESGSNALAMHESLKIIRNQLYVFLNNAFSTYLLSISNNPDGDEQSSIAKALFTRKVLHWNVDFVNIIENGGFDVVIGNPPYIEDKDYAPQDLRIIKRFRSDKKSIKFPTFYRSMDAGNTHAYFIERSLKLMNSDGKFGFIVPISLISTDRMSSIRQVIHDLSSEVAYYNFDDRPGKIFSGIEHCRSTIVITKKGNGVNSVTTSKYHRWLSKDRPNLFDNLYTSSFELTEKGALIPKLGCDIEQNILKKIKDQSAGKTLKDFQTKVGKKIWYHNTPQYWIHAHFDEYVPKVEYYKNFRIDKNTRKIEPLGSPYEIRITDQYKPLEFTGSLAPVVAAILNSSLAYWWFVIYSDGRHLLSETVLSIPVNLGSLSNDLIDRISRKSLELMESFDKNSNIKINVRKGGYAIKIKEIIPKRSLSIISGTDDLIAALFSLTDEESEFIKKFDLGFRLGSSESED